ncbi:MAG: glycosyltransferase family 4 protein [Elusimicrobiales bacterium]|nr:glycosyltransferase family 4 protein [Elusimicrobiales bacterium]
MKKISVVHIITKLELGGAQENTLYTVENMDKNIFDVILVSGMGGMLDERARKSGVKTFFIKELRREISPFNDLAAFLKIFFLLRKIKPDIIHTHSSKAGIIARAAGFLAGVKKIVHTYHGFGFNDFQKFYIRWLYIFLERISSLFTDFIIFVSNDNLKTALKYKILKNNNYRVIRSGIKMSRFKKEKNYEYIKKLGIEKKDLRIIVYTVANLKPQKNPDDFIEVANKVIKENFDVYFIYGGGGEKIEHYRNKARELGISNRCFFTGWIEDSSLLHLSGDIFILTSLWEGLPRSLVEAMSSGSVPVCYRTDGVNDLILNKKNGFIVDQKDTAMMSELIKELINNKILFNTLKEGVLNTDLSEFDIDFMVKEQEELYRKIIL